MALLEYSHLPLLCNVISVHVPKIRYNIYRNVQHLFLESKTVVLLCTNKIVCYSKLASFSLYFIISDVFNAILSWFNYDPDMKL